MPVSRLLIETSKDLATRDKSLVKLEREQDRFEREMTKLLPELEEHKQLSQLGPKDLSSAPWHIPAVRTAFNPMPPSSEGSSSCLPVNQSLIRLYRGGP